MAVFSVPVEVSVWLDSAGVVLYVGEDELPAEVFSIYDLVDDFLESMPSDDDLEIIINDMEKSLARLKALL